MEVQGGIIGLSPPPKVFAVIRAVTKNIPVAIRERGERRESPQSICPDVQPWSF